MEEVFCKRAGFKVSKEYCELTQATSDKGEMCWKCVHLSEAQAEEKEERDKLSTICVEFDCYDLASTRGRCRKHYQQLRYRERKLGKGRKNAKK